MKIGTSSYSFQQYIRDGRLTQKSAISKAKEMGFDDIEFTDLTPPEGTSQLEYASELKEEAAKCGIEISAYAIGANLAKADDTELKAEIERLKGQVDVAKAMGAKFMRHDVMYGYDDFRAFDMALPTIAKAAREVTEYAEALGIRTMVENHGYICQDPDRVEKLICTVNHPNYGLLLDIGNFLCADVAPELAVARLVNLAFMIHAKDFRIYDYYLGKDIGFTTRAKNRLEGMSVGYGDIRMKQCLEIIKASGFDGYMDIEYEGSGDCIEGIQKSLDYLRKNI